MSCTGNISRAGWAAAAALLLSSLAPIHSTHADDRQAPECVLATKSVVYRAFGYDHIVRVENTCAHAMSCRVSTEGAPEQTVELEAGEHKEALLRRGSPAREFDYRLVCTEG